MKRSLALVTFLLLGAAGCSSIETQHRDWSGYTGPAAVNDSASARPPSPKLTAPGLGGRMRR